MNLESIIHRDLYCISEDSTSNLEDHEAREYLREILTGRATLLEDRGLCAVYRAQAYGLPALDGRFDKIGQRVVAVLEEGA